MGKEPPENHGVGDVGDVKLIEAEQPGLVGQRVGDQPDRIFAFMLAALHFLPDRVNAFVHVQHEFVKMRAALAPTGLASKNKSISMVLPRPTSP